MRHFLIRDQRTDFSDPPSPEPERPMRVWGWLASLVLGVVAAVVGQIPALVALILFHERGVSLAKLHGLAGDGVAVIILTCVSTPIQVGLLFWFARLRVPSPLGYLALTLPCKRDIILLVLVVMAVIAAGDGLELAVRGEHCHAVSNRQRWGAGARWRSSSENFLTRRAAMRFCLRDAGGTGLFVRPAAGAALWP